MKRSSLRPLWLLPLVLLLLPIGRAEASHATTLVNLEQRDPGNGNANVPPGGTLVGTTVDIRAASNSPTCGGGSYRYELELRPVTQGFTGNPTYILPWQANFKPSCTVKYYPWSSHTVTAGVSYHWQVRERTSSGVGPWAGFGSSGTDFVAGGGVNTGGPYVVNEGDTITLTAIAPLATNVVWDLDGDGLYDDGAGTTAFYSAVGVDGTQVINIGVQGTVNGTVYTDTSTLTIANVAPVVTATVPETADEGDILLLSVSATDPGPDSLTYSWEILDPTGSVVHSAAGTSTTYTLPDDGAWTVEVSVGDGEDTTVDSTALSVANVPPEIITTVAVTVISEGDLWTYSPVVVEPASGDPLTWLLLQGPAGMNLDGATGVMSWVPGYNDTGSHPVEVQVDDGDGGVDSEAFTLEVILVDDDNDLMPDNWELANGLDPTDPGDAAGDLDQDGLTNLAEWQNGTNPTIFDGPTAPIAVLPSDGAELPLTQPSFNWGNATDPQNDVLTYDIQIYEDALGTVVAAQAIQLPENPVGQNAWGTPTPLNENQEYFWRVRARDTWTPGPWTAMRSFFVNAVNDPPDVPVPLYPIDGEVATSLRPTPQWAEAADVDRDSVHYEVRLWDDDHAVVLSQGTVHPETRDVAWTVDLQLFEDWWYSWDVRAVDEHGLAGDWSEPALFIASAENGIPTPLTFLQPDQDGVVESLSPVLVVAGGVDPEGQVLDFVFQLDTTDTWTGEDLVEGHAVGSEAGGAAWDLSVDGIELEDNQVWHARARVVDPQGAGSPWATVSFFLRGPNDPPAVPRLIAPADGWEGPEREPVFVVGWSEDPEGDPVTYDIRLTSDAEGTAVIGQVSGLALGDGPSGDLDRTSWPSPEALNGTFFWTARAVDDDGGESDWAPVASFTVAQTTNPDDDEGRDGCACDSVAGSPRGSAAGLLLLPLLALLRRRRP